ncbi:hypothetical protein BJS_09040 [Bradyrhizobium japonicum SEMIA 5079]|nr:hypothetical protein BJS_09040 [Bradyrhizobium japonicum SEMIA 5079]
MKVAERPLPLRATPRASILSGVGRGVTRARPKSGATLAAAGSLPAWDFRARPHNTGRCLLLQDSVSFRLLLDG